MDILSSIIVVVRSAGERTTKTCVSLLKEIFTEESIHIIEIFPFSQALSASLKLSKRENKDWLLCIDADVLVSSHGIQKLLKTAESIDENIFQIQGLVLDKFFSVYRPAGNHLYRTVYAKKAIELIPKEGTSLRPETDMLNRMSEIGYPWVQCDAIVGIHDYEQYYSDIYRKCFLQAHKHKWLFAVLEKYWNEMAIKDTDFKVALWGLNSGKLYNDTVLVDKRFLENEAKNFLDQKLREKEYILSINMSDYIHSELKRYAANKNAFYQNKIFPKELWNKTYYLLDTKANTQISASFSKRIINNLHNILKRIGILIKKITNYKNTYLA